MGAENDPGFWCGLVSGIFFMMLIINVVIEVVDVVKPKKSKEVSDE